MRVAILIDSLKIGGAQTLQLTFARAARMRNLSVTLLSLHKDKNTPIPEELTALGVPIASFPARTLFHPSRVSRLISYIRKNNFDVLHTHLTASNILGPLLSKTCAIPVIATLHSASFDPRYHSTTRHNLETFALRLGANRVVAVGHVVAEAHSSRLRERSIEIIPNAVVPFETIAENECHKIRKSIIGDEKRPLLLSVGRLSLPKGYEDLITAFASVKKQHPQSALAIVGAGTLRDSLAAQIRQLGLDGSAFLLGQRNDVPKLLSAADLYVSSSHWEGLPVSVLEAMSAGLPVVATSVGDLKQIIKPEFGTLVAPKNPDALAAAISDLLSSVSRREEMGEAARNYVLANHSPLAWIDRYISLYEEVTRKRPPSRSNSELQIKEKRCAS